MAIGHPILGCDLYAHPLAFSASERLCLHATGLVLKHPSSKKKLNFPLRFLSNINLIRVHG